MLSDSIFDIVEQLYKNMEHYNESPFNYGQEYKDELIDAIITLRCIVYDLDHIGEMTNQSKEQIREEVVERVESIYRI
jgi:hypothetical protein